MVNTDIGELMKVKVGAPALDVEVSSVTRQETTVGRTPAAVFVITSEMIERSGARSIPEALRMAPGVQVSRTHAGSWQVSIRGYNEFFSNKILVQIDGRSIYNPWWGGVQWSAYHVPMELIDRIEVVRGPGASLWGANAVNGVINIVTKNAGETQGLHVHAGGGTADRAFATAYYGEKLDEDTSLRMYGTWLNTMWDRPNDASDLWNLGQGGFRIDSRIDDCNTFFIEGDYYDAQSGVNTPVLDLVGKSHGGNVLTSWTHSIDDRRQWTARAYYDVRDSGNEFGHSYDSKLDFDLAYQFQVGERHRLVSGVEYRNTRTWHDNYVHSQIEYDLADDMYDYFFQDEISLIDDKLYFTVGSKFTHNIFTTFEFQPTGRLLYLPDKKTSIWGAVSRAVRLPMRFELVQGAKTNPLDIHNVRSEDLLAWECGVRRQPTDAFSWEAAAFLYQYEDLISVETRSPSSVAPAYFYNDMDGQSYGFELNSELKMSERWRLRGAYSFVKMALHGDSRSVAQTYAAAVEGQTPNNQLYLTSSMDLSKCVQLDATWRYADWLPTGDISYYNVADVRLAWTPRKHLTFEVVGRNLLMEEHYERGALPYSSVNPVPAEVYGAVTWRR